MHHFDIAELARAWGMKTSDPKFWERLGEEMFSILLLGRTPPANDNTVPKQN